MQPTVPAIPINIPSVPRRVQHSSCDPCRKARAACDASRLGIRGRRDGDTCSRCRKRSEQCTFDFINNNKPGKSGRKGRKRALVEVTDESDQDLTSIDEVEDEWLTTIYESAFEMVFGSWIGCYSCPFGFRDTEASELAVSISRLCNELDIWMCQSSLGTDDNGQSSESLDDRLRLSKQAFAARWLPIASSTDSHRAMRRPKVTSLWRRARRETLKAINVTSYRSTLTLILFGSTPIPDDVSEEEELDGISGQVCIQAAMQQIQVLRARQRSLRFNGSKVSAQITRPFSPGDHSIDAKAFLNAENIAFWAALTFDTSASLTLACRPILSSGLFGIESESPWRLVKACGRIFHEVSKEWASSEVEINENTANQIIAATATWKLYVWKIVAVFKEALADGHGEAEVNRAFIAVTTAIDEYNETYRDLVVACQKRIHFLSQETKLRWYVAVLHYHLSVLMLLDIIEATDRYDLLSQLTAARNEAESSALNCLVFGLDNTFTLTLPQSENGDVSAVAERTSATVPLVSIDPYPHHVVATVRLLRKTVQTNFDTGSISLSVHRSLFSTLDRALKHLPESSKSVRAARDEMDTPI